MTHSSSYKWKVEFISKTALIGLVWPVACGGQSQQTNRCCCIMGHYWVCRHDDCDLAFKNENNDCICV